MDKDLINEIFRLNQIARESPLEGLVKREIFQELLFAKGKELIGIIGARGSGKTVILKQLLRAIDNSFYIALDSIDRETDILKLLSYLKEQYQYSTFLLDEVHFTKNINQHLKLLYDFSDVKVYFTSSIAIAMHESAHDLSRRVRLSTVSRFSFREYINLKRSLNLEKLSFEKILTGAGTEFLRQEDLFEPYLQGGSLPFGLEVQDWKQALEGTLNKVINHDLTRIAALSFEDIESIKKVIKHLGYNPVDGMNPSSIAKNTGVSRYTTENYLNLLEQSFIIQQIRPFGKNVLKESKILLGPAIRLLYRKYDECLGELREDFAVDCLKSAGLNFYYLKNKRGEKTPDLLVEFNGKKVILEIGGSGKARSQFKGVGSKLEKYVFKHGGPYSKQNLPLCLLGALN